MGLVAISKGSFGTGDRWGKIFRSSTGASLCLDIYGVLQPGKAYNGGHVKKTRCERPLASLLCWSEQRQSCELERGSSSIADDPCLVTESTLSRPKKDHDLAHNLFYVWVRTRRPRFRLLRTRPPSDGTLQQDHEENVPMGFSLPYQVQQIKSRSEEQSSAACMVPSRTDTCLLTRETVWGPVKPGPRPVIFCVFHVSMVG